MSSHGHRHFNDIMMFVNCLQRIFWHQMAAQCSWSTFKMREVWPKIQRYNSGSTIPDRKVVELWVISKRLSGILKLLKRKHQTSVAWLCFLRSGALTILTSQCRYAWFALDIILIVLSRPAYAGINHAWTICQKYKINVIENAIFLDKNRN